MGFHRSPVVILVTALFIRSTFGVVFGLAFGAAMIAAGKLLPEEINDAWLKFLGLTSTMYAIIDIKEDLISRTVPGSDAYAMSKLGAEVMEILNMVRETDSKA